MRIKTTPRPYILTFRSSGHSYTIAADEAQRLLDAYPAVTATSRKVVLVGHNSAHAYDRTVLTPATRGSGPAFILESE